MRHELKTDGDVFRDVWQGNKNFEIRKNDRNFQVGDTLLLQETVSTGEEMASGASLEYTGYDIEVTVTYILHGPIYGLMDGWCIMAIAK